MKAKVGIKVFFMYDDMEYEREIEDIVSYKNYSWIGDLGFGGNVMFLLHGALENGVPMMQELAIQVDGVGTDIHEYIREGITFD
jgi:hypothetical protein